MDRSKKIAAEEVQVCTVSPTWAWVVKNRALLLRGAMLLCLSCTTAVCGTVTFYLLSDQETKLAETQYESISASALDAIVADVERKVLGNQVLAAVAANFYPDLEMWPNVTIPGFKEIALKIRTSSLKSSYAVGVSSIASLDQQSQFEAFAAENIAETYPPGVGVTSEGVVIWKVDPTISAGDPRVRDSTGITDWGSEYDGLLVPVFQVEADDPSIFNLVMFNLHTDEVRGRAIDSVLRCVEAAVKQSDYPACGAASSRAASFLNLDTSRFFSIYEPVFPANNRSTVVAMVGASLEWGTILGDIVPNFVTGLDVVVEVSGKVAEESNSFLEHTFEIIDGKTKFVADKDSHDDEYSSYRRRRRFRDHGLFESSDVQYSVSIYPTETFYRYYQTDTPWLATMVVVLLIAFTSLVFVVYDIVMRRENQYQLHVLSEKRKFVRYVSHEIRTPLTRSSWG